MAELNDVNSVPENILISFLDFEENDFCKHLFNCLQDIILICGERMDLRLLDGLTVGTDYRKALNSVDLGYESSSAKGVTNNENFVGVGKTIPVHREGKIKFHIVLNANAVAPITDTSHKNFKLSANIVAHELGHVVCASWFEHHYPGKTLELFSHDWITQVLRSSAHTIWEEYVACRLSAFISDDIIQSDYIELVHSSTPGALQNAKNAIVSYSSHKNTSRLFVETSNALLQPLRYCSYLLGHLDGVDDEDDINLLHSVLESSEFGMFIPSLLTSLRKAWQERLNWSEMQEIDNIVNVLLLIYQSVGVDIKINKNYPGTRIEIFSS